MEIMPFFLPFLGGVLAKAATSVAVGAVTSIASKAFAPKAKTQTQTVTNRVDGEQLRADARKAGFNPLTYLRHVGGGYTSTTTRTPYNPPNYAGQIFSNVASSIVGNIYENNSAQDRNLELRNMLMENELFGPKTKQFGGFQTRNIGNSIIANTDTSGITGNPYPSEWKQGHVTVTNPTRNLRINPNNADVSVWEDRLGEASFGSPTWFASWYTSFGDILSNVTRRVHEDQSSRIAARVASGLPAKPVYTLETFRNQTWNNPRNSGGGF
jgi:hypothetical protein